jgi:lipoyl(octanoyl) transferase
MRMALALTSLLKKKADKMSALTPCTIYNLGRLGYKEALVIQEDLARRRIKNEITDTILLLEHDPIVTIGRSVKPGEEDTEMLVPRDTLLRSGIQVIRTDRGGRLTYHGPGQLVAYFIINLQKNHLKVSSYISGLEESMIRTLSNFGITAVRQKGRVGIWVGGVKIGSIGLTIERWVSRHGLALNVNTDLSAFDYIIPCGLTGCAVTSMSKLLGNEIEMSAVKKSLVYNIASFFGLNIQERE